MKVASARRASNIVRRKCRDRLCKTPNHRQFVIFSPVNEGIIRRSIKEDKPIISINIPVHDGYVKRMLVYCIPSVLAQTYKDFEIIIAGDDLNPNNTQVIKNYFSSKKCKMRFTNIKKSMLGIDAWNACIDLSVGEWLHHLDADDFWTSDHLELLVKKSQEGDYNILYGQQHWHGFVVGYGGFGTGCNGHSSTMWKRKDFKELRYKFNGDFTDAHMWNQMLATNKTKVGFVQKVMTYESPVDH